MTTSNMPNEGEQQRYDDNDEGLHPDDVLITKWFPECTTLELLDDESTRYHMLREAKEAEADIKNGINRVPPQVPWPKPPPRPRCQLEVGIEEWRRPRIRMMNRLIAQWTTAKTTHPRHHGTQAAPVTPKRSQSQRQGMSKAHHALHVAELLEMIVGLLDPKSMLTLCSVSTTLRAAVAVVLGLQYRKAYPCAPIEYNEKIPPGLEWIEPTKAEIAELELDIRDRSDPDYYSTIPFVPTARITQAQCLPIETCISARAMWNSGRRRDPWIPHLPLDASDNSWLDLSQIKINPYLSHCFGDRAQEVDGMLEINLLSGPAYTSRSPFLTVDSLSTLVRPMYATQPPCKSLGIYVHISEAQLHHRYIRHLAFVEADDGVTIGQLVDAIEQQSPAAVDSWIEDVRVHREMFEDTHWTYFSLTRSDARDKWSESCECEVGPKIVVFFDGQKPASHTCCVAEAIYSLTLTDCMEERLVRLSKDWRDAFDQWNEKELESEP